MKKLVNNNLYNLYNHPKVTAHIWDIIRASPEYFPIGILIYFIMIPSPQILFLFIMSLMVLFSNLGFKMLIFKPLYRLAGNDYLPLIGRGSRPNGAIDCSTFIKCNQKLSTSFGMPSGHAQFGWWLVGFFLPLIWESYEYKDEDFLKPTEQKTYVKILQTIGVIVLALVICYSRVYVEKCHTIQQVVVGSIIGVGYGYFTYWLYRLFIRRGIIRAKF